MASIRKKFSLITQIIVIVSVIIFGLIIFLLIKNALLRFAFESLKNNANVLYSLVEKNYKLEKEIYKYEIITARIKVKDYYDKSARTFTEQMPRMNMKNLSKEQLKKIIKDYFKTKGIGSSGYFTVQSQDGEVLYHPDETIIGQNLIRNGSDSEFVSWQMQKQNGFHEYSEQINRSGSFYYNERIIYQNFFNQYGIVIAFTIEKKELVLLTNQTFFSEKLKSNIVDAIMSLTVGKHGYAYINNSNAVVIAHPRGSLGADIRKYDFAQYTINSSNSEKATREAMTFSYQWKNPGENSYSKKIMAYRYFQPNDWYIVVTAYPEDIYGGILTNIMLVIILIILATMIVTGFIISLSSRAIVKSIVNISDSLVQISRGQGDLTYRLEAKGKDETTKLGNGFNGFMEWINNLINKIKSVSKEVFENTDGLDAQIAGAINRLEKMLESIHQIDVFMNMQNGQVRVTANKINEMLSNFDTTAADIESQSSAVAQSSSAIQEMSANINNVTEIAKNGSAISSNLTNAAKNGGKTINLAISSIHEMEESGRKIGEIMAIISGIAEQTNLLAMNAAIEAAHAGDYGRGFAVVADEIRKLAESSAASSKEISALIRTNSDKIKNTVALAEEANTGLEQILRDVEQTERINTEITSAMIEQSIGAKEVLTSMTALVEITEKIRSSILTQKANSTNIKHVISILENQSSTIADNFDIITGNTTTIKETFSDIKYASYQAAMGSNKLFNLVSIFKIDEKEEMFSKKDTELIHNELKYKTEEMIKYLDSTVSKVAQKEITMEQAKEICGKYLLSQKVGTKGYFCGLSPQAKLVWHPVPAFVGVTFDINLPKFYFIRWMVKKETGYYEYIWWEDEKMPDGTTKTVFNEKALYQIYYEPFDLMIYSTAYKSDFAILLGKEKESPKSISLAK